MSTKKPFQSKHTMKWSNFKSGFFNWERVLSSDFD